MTKMHSELPPQMFDCGRLGIKVDFFVNSLERSMPVLGLV